MERSAAEWAMKTDEFKRAEVREEEEARSRASSSECVRVESCNASTAPAHAQWRGCSKLFQPLPETRDDFWLSPLSLPQLCSTGKMSAASLSDAFDPVKTFGQLLERDDVSPRNSLFPRSLAPDRSCNVPHSQCQHQSQP